MPIEINNSQNPYAGRIDQTDTADKGLGYNSPLGTPVIVDLTLKGGFYKDNAGKLVSFNDIVLLNVLVNVSQSKKIVCTEIPGMDGTIKEYIGMGDYELSIVGALDGPNGHYPIDEVNTLHQICKASVPVDVVSRHLLNFDIYSIVIKDFSYDDEPGGYSSQRFSIQAVSDVPIIIQMQNA